MKYYIYNYKLNSLLKAVVSHRSGEFNEFNHLWHSGYIETCSNEFRRWDSIGAHRDKPFKFLTELWDIKEITDKDELFAELL